MAFGRKPKGKEKKSFSRPLFKRRKYCRFTAEKIEWIDYKDVELLKDFINENMRLEPVVLQEDTELDELLAYYMGKNTPDRQEFIIDNLRFEVDEVEDDLLEEEAPKEEAELVEA